MRLLLDTHTFLWWAGEPERLSDRVRTLLNDPATVLLLSVISLWEIQIKAQIGKLTLKTPLQTLVENQQRVNQIEILTVEFAHVLALDAIPMHHKHPFDRMLIAQATVEQAVLASNDTLFNRYPIRVVWR